MTKNYIDAIFIIMNEMRIYAGSPWAKGSQASGVPTVLSRDLLEAQRYELRADGDKGIAAFVNDSLIDSEVNVLGFALSK